MGSYKTVTVDTTVDVDIDLEDFDDSDIIDEIKERGYKVYGEDDEDEHHLSRYELEKLTEIIGEQKVGSELWSVREKLYGMLRCR